MRLNLWTDGKQKGDLFDQTIRRTAAIVELERKQYVAEYGHEIIISESTAVTCGEMTGKQYKM